MKLKTDIQRWNDLVCGCCATYPIFNFEYDYDQEYGDEDDEPNEDFWVGYRARLLKDLDVVLKDAREHNKSLIVATTNDAQKRASEVLEEFGFQSSDWADRPLDKYGDSPKVKLWYYIVSQKKPKG